MSLSSLLSRLNESSSARIPLYRAGSGTVATLAASLLAQGRNVVAVARSDAEFAELRALLTLFSPDSATDSGQDVPWGSAFISLPKHPAGSGGKSGWAERMAALYALKMRRKVQGVLASLDNFLLRLPPVDIFEKHELTLSKGMGMDPALVLEQAIDWGYVRAPMVGRPGEIAVRGDILDIFCPGYTKPLRLEFFGDTLEDIRRFDPSSQRSVADETEMVLLPVAPVIAGKKLREEAEIFWKKQVQDGRLEKGDLAPLLRAAEAGGKGLFSGMFYERASRLEDWLPPDPVFLLPGETETADILSAAESRWTDHLHDVAEMGGPKQPKNLALRPAEDVLRLFASSPRVCKEDLRIGVAEEHAGAASLAEKSYASFQEVFPGTEAQERPWHHLVALMRRWGLVGARGAEDAGKEDGGVPLPSSFAHNGKGRLVLSFSSDRARARFLRLASQDNIFPKLRFDPEEFGVFALVSAFRNGAFLQWDNTLVLGEDVVQPKVERGGRAPKSAFQGLERYDTLAEGDFLVHRDYGVAAFGGLHRVDLGGAKNDYLLLRYAGGDKLYLPVDRLSLIQRFKGADGAAPAPDKLGGTNWSSSKEKAKKAIEQIAADLVEMYALRKVVKGFRYSPVNELYREFEVTFGFEETPDQQKAIDDVLADMEKAEPMDRLVCGDVGFGKTEVALRAAVRAALDGRQTALLCPTTVLAEQHYQTFRSRLAGFPVNVGMLSRFVSRQKQKEVLVAAAKGQVDILIGTHRLLSKDVVLPNLGLLVLDEEQRFGVRHKERLKEMRKNVDALTLTATPIPRTLQLSLSGIRELSVIETPPPERKPVATALIDRDDNALRSIVERELARQGQVFWVYNRVQGLERVAEYVKKLVPHARVGMAHGQMSESALEDAMHKFWHGEIDVLVCTSIVESGLDFPKANTLIVDQAQLFGLGQLYQLRGRVGRSDRQAFAVFIAPDPDRLPELARKRLQVVLDMDFLGAGFQVAMEDLRLRGAGNILGESQSGHMNRLGLDLFLEMLEEAVAKAKGSPLKHFAETELSIGIPAYIPETYVDDAKERLRYYKLLSSAPDDTALREIAAELRDRFGAAPPELESFVAVLDFKRRLSRWGVMKADIYTDKLRIALSEQSGADPARLVAFVAARQAAGMKVKLQPPAVLEFPLTGETPRASLEEAASILRELLGPEAEQTAA